MSNSSTQLAPYTQAKILAKGIMNGGFSWSVDGPAIIGMVEYLYAHYEALFPAWYWDRIAVEMVQGLVRAQVLQWAAENHWDAPVLDDSQEDVIWGWMSDGTVRLLHTGSYR